MTTNNDVLYNFFDCILKKRNKKKMCPTFDLTSFLPRSREGSEGNDEGRIATRLYLLC